MTRTTKTIKSFALATILGTALFAGNAAYSGEKAVLELFTSQGCSSCPPADDLATKLAERDDLLVLTLPVHYWDYLGWKDTFARPEHADRQYGYARLRGDGQVYTPQVVVNGVAHVVGSREEQIEAAVSQAKALNVDINMQAANGRVTVDVGDAGASGAAEGTLWLVTYKKSGSVKIARGENHGRSQTYTNIVTDMRPVGMWKGDAMSVELPISEIMKEGADGCAIILQRSAGNGIPSGIIGAANLKNWSPS